jgi:glycosyltransferase involved in cell wall biosynthesis
VRKLWIAWEDDTSIRSRVLARELQAQYAAFTRFTDSKWFGWLRYLVATVQTVWTITRRRPHLLVVQQPSILLAFEAALLRPLLGFRLVVDLHTPLIKPTGASGLIAAALHEYALRHCTAVIVTNDGYKRTVARTTDRRIFVLPDKIPVFESPARTLVPITRSVLYICTYSSDEPWSEVVAAAALLPESTRTYISGRGPLTQDQVPGNVILTGYLPRNEYEVLLHSVDAVMVLTTADDNLVCGGYEAVAAGKPLILSDTHALRALFRRGAVFTNNESAAIARAINTALRRADALRSEIKELSREMQVDWERSWQAIWEELELPTRDRTVAEEAHGQGSGA